MRTFKWLVPTGVSLPKTLRAFRLCWLACLASCATPILQEQPANAAIPPAIASNGIMVDSVRQMALYTYDGDDVNKSCCTGDCEKEWLPLPARENATDRGDFSVFQRPDGRKQWALMGRPLYFWSHDSEPGEVTGEAGDARWRVFRISDYTEQGQPTRTLRQPEC